METLTIIKNVCLKIKCTIILNSPFFANIPSKTIDKKIKVCYNDNSRKYRGTYI